MELRNPFSNAKIIGPGIDQETYLRQAPGIDRGHQDFVMSRSELMWFASNPSRWINGYSPKETDATEFGSLVDCIITDGDRFEKRYAVQPATVAATASMKCVRSGAVAEGDPVPWRTCKEASDWDDAHADFRIISSKEHDEATQACQRALNHPVISELLHCSQFQVMAVAEYHDPETKIVVPWKALIDIVPRKDHPTYGRFLADLKTCRNAEPNRWEREVDDRNYDAQAASNMDVYTMATKEDRDSFAHILIENTFPFEPSTELLSLDYLDKGRIKIIGALRWYCRCLKALDWPSWDSFTERKIVDGMILCEPREWHSTNKPR